MSIEPGRHLGAYEILSPIGAGGMGEVYKARDTRLDRTVAIKVLPEHLSNDPERRERFEREARAVSSLNHPNICTLHDIGEHDGIHYLVMEYLEGETLADRLKKGALPFEQALDVAAQIAGALDKAHRAGIVHRDLKPGNVMLAKPGVKLLDFGLAKTREEPIAPTNDSEQPTQNKPLTDAGTILGTVQYMAPEQLEGKDVDARADLFALGAVLYETLTGRKAFTGESQASLISAILSTEPPSVSELQTMSPPALDRVVKKCLAKDPEARWYAAHDLEDELKWIASSDTKITKTTSGVSNRGLYAIAAATVVGLAVGAALVGRGRGADTSQRSYHLIADLPDDVQLIQRPASFALSPNGSTLVYGARRDGVAQLWKRDLTAYEHVPLAGTENARGAFFSPDGEWIGFFSDGGLRKLHLERGALQMVIPVSVSSPDGSWGHDGYIYFSTDVRAGLARVPADGGDVEHLTTPDYRSDEVGHSSPVLLPDGEHALFNVLIGAGGRAAILSLETGTWSRLDQLGVLADARYLPTGHLTYVSSESSALMVVAFDPETLEPVGPPSELEQNVFVTASFTPGFPFYAISNDGTLAFVRDSGREPSLAWLDPTGRVLRVLDRAATHPQFFPGDDRVVASVSSSDSLDIWIFGNRGTETRLTTSGTNDFPVWSPDGRHIVFSSTGGDLPQLSILRADGVGPHDVIWQGETNVRATSWSSDGRFLALEAQAETTARDIWILPLETKANGEGFDATREPRRLHEEAYNEGGAVFSPDGRWLAYASTQTDRAEVYVESFPALDERIVVSSGGGVEPVWSHDGTQLFYRWDESLFRARIVTEPRLRAEPPEELFEVGGGASNTHAHYDTVRDEGFVMRRQRTLLEEGRVHVVTNVFDRIKALTSEE